MGTNISKNFSSAHDVRIKKKSAGGASLQRRRVSSKNNLNSKSNERGESCHQPVFCVRLEFWFRSLCGIGKSSFLPLLKPVPEVLVVVTENEL